MIRTFSDSLAIKPDASKTVVIPLLNIPAVASGNYYLVTEITDPEANRTSVASTATYTLET